MSQSTYEKLRTELREIGTLGTVSALVGWDEQVMLKPGGTEFRSQQGALLARMIHERFTSKQLGDWIGELEGSTPENEDARVILRELRHDYDRATKLPSSLVEELARTTTLSQAAWVEARSKKDFATFSPWLTKMLDLKRKEAACLGSASGHPYDALLEGYEPGETCESLTKLFDAMKPRLVALIERTADSGKVAPLEILERRYPAAAQEKLAREAAAAIGFDVNAGRLDISVHPFCSGIAPGDTRITTRYDEQFFGDAFFGTLHETGHAMYEQGLPKSTHFGTALADATSLGIHESQSRLWENLVGRSRPFWSLFFGKAREAFAPTLDDVSMDDWMFAVNDIRPSFIRTEADEATYNLHILLRFEIEQKMLKGDLNVADIPKVWDETFKRYFGIDVPDISKGCLQDVHWSCGLIGYFPTYSLGNMYAAQFYRAATRAIPDLESLIAKGEFSPLLSWLRANIHMHGRRYRGRELAQRVTGEDVSPNALLDHLEARGREYYGV